MGGRLQDESKDAASRMDVNEALRVLADLRRPDQIVVTNQGSARLWPKLSDHPLDFNYNPSAMGGAVPLGLGVALAQPQREVVVVSGEGSLLMNLGCLVTVVDSGATNLTIVVLDNGIYEVTGGQKTAATQSQTDFAGLARAAGFPNVSHFWNANDWRRRSPGVFDQRGPRFIWLEVAPLSDPLPIDPPRPVTEQIARLRKALD